MNNTDEQMNAVKQFLTLFFGMLTGMMPGLATSQQYTALTTAIITAVPALISIGSVAWSIYTHWRMKKVPQNSTAVAIPSGPAMVGSKVNLAGGVAAKVVGALLIGFLIMHWSTPASAQTKTTTTSVPCTDLLHLLPPGCAPPSNTIGNGGIANLLQQIYDRLHDGGEVIIADMQKAAAIAATKMPDGSVADAPSQQCLSALIPVAQLIIDNQIVPVGVTPAAPPATGPAAAPLAPDGLVTQFVKIRVVVNALQAPAVQSGCAWLQQSLNLAGTQGLSTILGGVFGVTKLAPLIGLP